MSWTLRSISITETSSLLRSSPPLLCASAPFGIPWVTLNVKHVSTAQRQFPTFHIKACVKFLSSLCRLVCRQYAVAFYSYLTEAPVSVILPTSSVFDTSSTIYFRSAPLHAPDESASPFHRTLNTVSFEYSTSGWFAYLNCMMYAVGLLPSLIQHS